MMIIIRCQARYQSCSTPGAKTKEGNLRSSLRRLKEKGRHGFGWQNGCDAFSVSESNLASVTAYIVSQAEHHKKFSYQDEIREIFKRHRVAFDERYVWNRNANGSDALAGRVAWRHFTQG